MTPTHPRPDRRSPEDSSVPAPSSAPSGAPILAALPYATNALEPHLAEKTVHLHRRRQQAHLEVVAREMAPGSDVSLEETLRTAPPSSSLYRSAAQCWNYAFLWRCIGPARGSAPTQPVEAAITGAFGGFHEMCHAFADGPQGRFSSGWTWLAKSPARNLEIIGTNHDATPCGTAYRPLIVLDVWEFSFYWERTLKIDSRSARHRFVESCMSEIVDWEFVSEQWVEDEP